MKTTFELPDELVNQVKLRAASEGWILQDAIAELLRQGLAASVMTHPTAPVKASPRIQQDSATGLPVILCDPDAPARTMTVQELLKVEQHTQTWDDLERLGVTL